MAGFWSGGKEEGGSRDDCPTMNVCLCIKLSGSWEEARVRDQDKILSHNLLLTRGAECPALALGKAPPLPSHEFIPL